MRPAPAAVLAALLLAAASPRAEAPAAGASEADAAQPEAAQADEWVVLETDAGELWINLFEEHAPEHAENFKKLVRQGWYDGTPFHRVIRGFVAQGGGRFDEEGEITDVGYTLPAEIDGRLRHVRGSVAAARRGDPVNPARRSSGSQFYLCLRPQPQLDLQYTVFGHVIRGLETMDAIRAAPPGAGNGAVPPERATRIRRAWLRPASEPGSAPPEEHDHDHH